MTLWLKIIVVKTNPWSVYHFLKKAVQLGRVELSTGGFFSWKQAVQFWRTCEPSLTEDYTGFPIPQQHILIMKPDRISMIQLQVKEEFI